MPITPKFTESQVKSHFDDFLKTVIERQIERLKYLGEMCVKHAKENGAYTDQTGNLRNSIGYIVFFDGQAIHEEFTMPESRQLAMGIGKLYAKDVVLIVVAGMDYALYVEAKGFNVLTATERFAEVELPKMIRDLTENIKKA